MEAGASVIVSTPSLSAPASSSRQLSFDTGRVTVGVDPGTQSIGLAALRGDGEVIFSCSIRAKVREHAQSLEKMLSIWLQLKPALEEIKRLTEGLTVSAVIEETTPFNRPKRKKNEQTQEEETQGADPVTLSAHKISEVRGVITARFWQYGIPVQKLFVQSWKSALTKEERAMRKNGSYVRYWNERKGWGAKSPDEVDAHFIAERVACGK